MTQKSIQYCTAKPILEKAVDYVVNHRELFANGSKFVVRNHWSSLSLALRRLRSFINITLVVQTALSSVGQAFAAMSSCIFLTTLCFVL